jgi:hypothetical protein
LKYSQGLDGEGEQSGMPPRLAYSPTSQSEAVHPKLKTRKVRQFWMKQLHSWHWISAALSLIGMFLFAITGITLNHAESISAQPRVVAGEAVLPPQMLVALNRSGAAKGPLPLTVSHKVDALVGLNPGSTRPEWTDGEVYVAMPGPGTDAWVSIDRTTGAITSEHTDRGWVSYLNDLHKGRNTGSAWFWFIDVFAVACIVFTITGLLLLQLHARRRPSTWPIVAAGAAIPVIIAMFFIHS